MAGTEQHGLDQHRPGPRALEPLPYHRALVELLGELEPELWAWMSAQGRLQQESESIRDQLLRSTYRLDDAGHPVVADAARRAGEALGLTVPVHVFQAEGDLAPNASLLFVPDEAIVLLSGPIAEVLSAEELLALFGHELAHHLLWTRDGGAYLSAERMIDAMVGQGTGAAAAESERRFSLSTELFADRGALVAAGDLGVAVGTLVKVATGLRSVSVDAFLAQADEVLAADAKPSEGTTHPETFLRAAALRDWSEGEAAPSAALALVAGPLDVDQADLLDQQALARLTRTVIERITRPEWMRTDPVVSHAKAFFPDISSGGADGSEPPEPQGGRSLAASTRRYLAYVLMDFATADPDLEREPLVEALVLAGDLGVREELERAVADDLLLSARDWSEVLGRADGRTLAGGAPA